MGPTEYNQRRKAKVEGHNATEEVMDPKDEVWRKPNTQLVFQKTVENKSIKQKWQE